MNIIEAIQEYKACPVCHKKTDIIATIINDGRCDYTLQNDILPYKFVRRTELGNYPLSFTLSNDYGIRNTKYKIMCSTHYYSKLEIFFDDIYIEERIIFGKYFIINKKNICMAVYDGHPYNNKILLSLPYAMSTSIFNFNNENDFRNKLESLMILQ